MRPRSVYKGRHAKQQIYFPRTTKNSNKALQRVGIKSRAVPRTEHKNQQQTPRRFRQKPKVQVQSGAAKARHNLRKRIPLSGRNSAEDGAAASSAGASRTAHSSRRKQGRRGKKTVRAA